MNNVHTYLHCLGVFSKEKWWSKACRHFVLKDTDTLYLVTGLGGGISTGGTVEIAKRAKELGIKTVCVVSKPFYFEGKSVLNRAKNGLKKLKEIADIVIPICNDNFSGTFEEVFKKLINWCPTW